jgi:hypothetical protein
MQSSADPVATFTFLNSEAGEPMPQYEGGDQACGEKL